MNLLEVKNISKTYGNGETAVKALKDVSFSVPKGEYVAIVGESGSGKSTLLNMIGALDTPTSGKVLIDGKDIFAMNDRKLTVFRRRNIGFIFQAFNLIPELTVEQNIIFPQRSQDDGRGGPQNAGAFQERRSGGAPPRAALETQAWGEVRRLGRLFRHFGQPRHRGSLGSRGDARRRVRSGGIPRAVRRGSQHDFPLHPQGRQGALP